MNFSKDECMSLNKLESPNKVRIKVLSADVKQFNGKLPMKYRKLMNRPVFDDHRVFIRIGQKCIGFIVSPYNLHTERHEALKLDGHSVIEIRQQHHINAETILVIQNEYLNCVLWKTYYLE